MSKYLKSLLIIAFVATLSGGGIAAAIVLRPATDPMASYIAHAKLIFVQQDGTMICPKGARSLAGCRLLREPVR